MSVKVDGSKVRLFRTKAHARAGALSIGWPVSCCSAVHTRFQECWALGTGIVPDPITGLSYISRERFGELYRDRNGSKEPSF